MKFLGIGSSLALLVSVAGCASPDANSLAVRQKSYVRLASFIKPDMTRRQLYALLPPQRPPTVTTGETGFFGLPGLGILTETYPLDRDFAVSTSYIPAHPREPQASLAHRVSRAHHATTAQSIDDLLYGSLPAAALKPVPSKQDPDDTIFLPPVVMRSWHGATGKRFP